MVAQFCIRLLSLMLLPFTSDSIDYFPWCICTSVVQILYIYALVSAALKC